MRDQHSSYAWSDWHKRNRVLRRVRNLVVLTSAAALLPVVVLAADEGGSAPGGNNGIASKYVDDVGI